MKIPSSSDIKSLLDNVKSIVPSLGNVIKSFNTEVDAKQALKFAVGFPTVMTAISLVIEEINKFMDVDNVALINAESLANMLLLKNAGGKLYLNKDGKPMTVFDPIISMVEAVNAFSQKMDFKILFTLKMKLKLAKFAFNNILRTIKEILKENDEVIKSLVDNKTVKKITSEMESGKKTEEVIKEGTGGAFVELAVTFNSMLDIMNTIIKMGVKSKAVKYSTSLASAAIKDIFDKVINEFFAQWKDSTIGKMNDADFKKIAKRWETLRETITSMYSTVVILGLFAIPMILLAGFASLANMAIAKWFLPSLNEMFASLTDKKFVKNTMLVVGILTALIFDFLLITSLVVLCAHMAELDFCQVLLGLGGVVIVFGLIVGLMLFIGKFLKPKDLLKPMASILVLVSVMTMLTGLLLMISFIDSELILSSLVGLAGVALIALGILSLLKFINIGVNEVNGGAMDILKNLFVLGITMLMLVGILFVLDWAMGEIPFNKMLADIIILGLVSLVMVGIMVLMGQVKVNWQLVVTAMIMCIVTSVMAYSVSLIANSVDGVADLAAIILFTTMVFALVILFVVVGAICESGIGYAAILLAASAFLVIGASILMIATSIEKVVNSFKTIVELMQDKQKVIDALTAIPEVFGAFLGAIGSISIKDAAEAAIKAPLLMAAIMPTVSTISAMMKVIRDMCTGEYSFNDPDNPGEKVTMNLVEILNKGLLNQLGDHLKLIINGFVDAISGVPYDKAVKVIRRAKMMRKLGRMMKPITKMVDCIKNLASGTVELIDPEDNSKMMTVSLVELLNSDFADKIKNALTAIIGGFAGAIASIPWNTLKKASNREGFLEDLVDTVGPVYDLVQMIMDLSSGTIEIDGKKVDMISYIEANSVRIQDCISTIIKTFMNALAMGMSVDAAEDWWDDVFEEYMDAAEDGLDEVPKVLDLLTGLITGMDNISKIMDDMSSSGRLLTVGQNIQSCITAMMSWYQPYMVNAMPNVEKCAKSLSKISDEMVDVSENFGKLEDVNISKFVDESDKFIGSINKLNVSKANALANVLDKLADLSESLDGNFDKLADAINDKLINTLEDLSETLEKTSSKSSNVFDRFGSFLSGASQTAGGALNSILGGNDKREKENTESIKKISETLESIKKMAEGAGIKTKVAENYTGKLLNVTGNS